MSGWRGPYAAYLNTQRWQWLRKTRRALDGQRCVICGSKQKLQVHHLHYRYLNRPGRNGVLLELLSLITVCDHCHDVLTKVKKLAKSE